MENKKEKERKRKRREEKCPAVFYRDPKRVNEIPYRVAQQSLSPALSDIRQGRSSRFHPITHEFLALLHSVVASSRSLSRAGVDRVAEFEKKFKNVSFLLRSSAFPLVQFSA